VSLRPIFAKTMVSVAERDEKLVVIVGDISHGIFSEFRSAFPKRYFNIGISEPAMVNVAAGLSASGLIPVVHTIAPFLIERSYEQIKLDFAYQNLGANFISVGSAFEYSKLGCSHHCYSDYSLLSKFESCDIYYPGSENEFSIIFNNVYRNGRINYFRLTEYPNSIPFDSHLVKPGVAILEREGTDLTIVTAGSLLNRARNVADSLMKQGYQVDLVYLHTLKPLDLEAIEKSIMKTGKLLVIEENHKSDGIFSVINNSLAGSVIYKKKHLAIDDFVRSYGSYDALSADAGLSEDAIQKAAIELLGVEIG
jgi:transketolase